MATRKTRKTMTNEEFVADLMRFSRYGALAQLFVIDALTKFSAQVAAASPEQLDGMSGLIAADAWVGVAREISAKIKEAYTC